MEKKQKKHFLWWKCFYHFIACFFEKSLFQWYYFTHLYQNLKESTNHWYEQTRLSDSSFFPFQMSKYAQRFSCRKIARLSSQRNSAITVDSGYWHPNAIRKNQRNAIPMIFSDPFSTNPSSQMSELSNSVRIRNYNRWFNVRVVHVFSLMVISVVCEKADGNGMFFCFFLEKARKNIWWEKNVFLNIHKCFFKKHLCFYVFSHLCSKAKRKKKVRI